jgi:hypothetical protein
MKRFFGFVAAGLALLASTMPARAQVTVVDFDNPISLAQVPNTACDTVVGSPWYRDFAGVSGTGWNPIVTMKAGSGIGHYHLGFDNASIVNGQIVGVGECLVPGNGCYGVRSGGTCQMVEYQVEPRSIMAHQAGAVLELVLEDGGRTHQMDLLGIRVRSGNVNIKGYQPDGSHWNWFLGPGNWSTAGLNRWLTKITFEGYDGHNPSLDDISIESSFTSHNFAGQNSRGYDGDGNWSSGYFKGECEVDRALKGISSDSSRHPRVLRCKNHLYPKVTSGVTLSFSTANNRRSTTYGNWDSGYYKGECADNEVVVGVSQSTSSGAIKAVRCAPYSQAASPPAATSCVARSLGATATKDVTDWDAGFTKTSCAEGEVIKGVSRETASNGGLHKVLCCKYSGTDL